MSHIVLVNIENDTEKVKRQFSPPFGLLIAASVLIRNNVDVVVRHIINTKESLAELSEICKDALAVGFSVMTSPNLLSAIEASKILHNQGIFVYWAGTHASLLPEVVLKECYVDAVLRGEAECNLYEFYQWRIGKIKADNVRGLCYKKNGEVIISPLPPLVELSQLGYHPFELLDIKKYVDKSTKQNTPIQNNTMETSIIQIFIPGFISSRFEVCPATRRAACGKCCRPHGTSPVPKR